MTGDGTGDLAIRLRQQTILADFGVKALHEENISALLQLATELCAQGLEAQYCKALEYRPELGEFLVVAGVGWADGVVGKATIGADLASPAGFALKTSQPVISNHLRDDTRFHTPQLMADHGVRRAVNVLITNRDGDYGVLEVDDSNAGAFNETDIAFIQGFANLLGSAIERQRAEARLRAALERQDLLTREMSHRVKNSLTVVRSMLSLQARDEKDERVARALFDAQSRIDAVAQVHDQLWRQPELGFVELDAFTEALCGNLILAAPQHTITVAVPKVLVDADRATSIGLLITELVTNCVKYAYPDGCGDIRVAALLSEERWIVLTVSDDGVGLPADFDLGRISRTNLGMRIIRNLASQLEAETEIVRPGRGVTFSFTFPRERSRSA